jgi:GNAT superfamily N-acetyltransferase
VPALRSSQAHAGTCHVPGSSTGSLMLPADITYACRRAGDGLLTVTASVSGEPAGSVSVREHISVGRLHVNPAWRRQHVAWQLMEHLAVLYPHAEQWLYAEPYIPPGGEPGPSREALERFYGSLGFARCPDASGRVMMIRPAAVPQVPGG